MFVSRLAAAAKPRLARRVFSTNQSWDLPVGAGPNAEFPTLEGKAFPKPNTDPDPNTSVWVMLDRLAENAFLTDIVRGVRYMFVFSTTR